MKIKIFHWFGIAIGILIIILDFILFLDKTPFTFTFGVGIAVIILPFIAEIVIENRRDEQISEMFLNFIRDVAESVKTGTPISKSITNMKRNEYGELGKYVEKLANQLELGIPVESALRNFAYEVSNPLISRAVEMISEAGKAGGEIEQILDSVASSISQVEKLKKERTAAISNLVVQGYIIFFIFIIVMLIMEFKILPLTSDVSYLSGAGTLASGIGATTSTPQELARPFLYLLLVQGLFAGLTIGKLSEGAVKAGIKHSFILATAAFLISTGAELIFS